MVLPFLWFVLAHAQDFETVSRHQMATRIDVTVPTAQREAAPQVFAVFEEVEAAANEWRTGSPLSDVNEAAGVSAVVVPVNVFALVQRGIEIGKLSQGTFDISWAALWGVWDFRTPAPPPDPALLASRVALVDYTAVVLDDTQSSIFLPKAGMKLGVGGIAKGYALNLGAAALRQAGVTDFTLSAGGQVYAGGHKNNRPWRVGIRDPRGEESDYFAVIEVSDQSVSTSGDYERFFLHEGVRYHHILDPRTGQPARGLRSATVVSADATTADALSTAVMVLGKTEGLRLIQAVEGAEAAVVDTDGRVFTTPGMTLHLIHPPKKSSD